MKVCCLFKYGFFCIFLFGKIYLFSHNINEYINLFLPGVDSSSCIQPTIKVYLEVFEEFIKDNEAMLAKNAWQAERTCRGCDIGFEEFQSAKNYSGYHCPFIQKRCMPTRYPVCIVGDLHGDAIAVAKILNRMVTGDSEGKGKILNPDYSVIDPTSLIIFLGDYVDRGPQSLEVLFLLSLFKKQNPANVFLLRGNHELFALNVLGDRNLNSELDKKFSDIDEKNRLFTKILQMYEYMPVSLFLISGNSITQYCHGGINPDFLPAEFLINGAVMFDSLCQVPISSWVGLLWSDFCSGCSFGGDPLPNDDRGSGFVYDVRATQGYFDSLNSKLGSLNSPLKLKLIMRGHQHEDGFFPLRLLSKKLSLTDSGLRYWKIFFDETPSFKVCESIPVLTLSSFSVCGSKCQYSYCVLGVDGDFENWIVTPVEG